MVVVGGEDEVVRSRRACRVRVCSRSACFNTATDLILNVRDGERWEITAPTGVAGVENLLQDVLRAKYSTEGKVSTDVFLENCRRIRDEVAQMW